MQCLAFLGNGDVLTGDSGGVILIWSKTTVEPTPGKGPKGIVFPHQSPHFKCTCLAVALLLPMPFVFKVFHDDLFLKIKFLTVIH